MTENNFNRRDFIKLSAVGLAVAAGTRIIQEAGASRCRKRRASVGDGD
ncbi:MAG: twin-arginine translocation signal domain-containing protein [Anaerolineales bacterium]|nr:twin-arginine translocation signal domain-containing protein [Anaerolineales bacterium]